MSIDFDEKQRRNRAHLQVLFTTNCHSILLHARQSGRSRGGSFFGGCDAAKEPIQRARADETGRDAGAQVQENKSTYTGCIILRSGASLPGPWRRLPRLPESKEQFGLEACAGRIYAVAGICNDEETSACFVYDTDKGRWAPIAPLPIDVQSPCLRAVKGRLFCFGG